MAEPRLSAKQREALQACVDPSSTQAFKFWVRAGAYGGPVDGRRAHGIGVTLGSLARLGLVEYESGWRATNAGRERLA
jgi:hypothetical protein